ncbi:Dad3p KNAG_0F02360 [Huiozyma naganishii CBS 8797]|uniref:DASH complex subunit DAD3 n=1 Tax=Huiozyma naganishii (strain ATCC MYA-139 / BCRC 22969 / CBS 8797 / KCTC 17520 / NBRC 10181 / NCYC 3082 / Yp74L-3) TaxID=1071383 RepID=J7S8G0_HUIN7|nr:hypothetical protein KNAG_0F02360 [Kazachstania naganishii CBS 8797]CCK70901.1 hypothetical protein KNAG_0F02360 [Kazachstania naganishii CBS 8797]
MSQDLTPLQQSVLEKYSSLSEALHDLDESIKELNRSKEGNSADVSADDVLQEMRAIETRIGLIGTLLKGSVYSLILQRGNDWNN